MSYWKPPAALYPLFFTFAAAGYCVAWSGLRQLRSNPDVHLTKAHRTDGAAEEGTTLRRAEEYGHSMFRHFYTMRKGDNERPDTRIMRW
ncbi:hypothetical protein D9Q98_005484 [Chlorella vulgaris]|uniref:Uncharacterized protein n=1 Tax=Chlorella vulgaris TaxID=3077 RepID=A0A9D4TM62_CHLVU|nr:hypothetical protein D9Q98_005484 [Chlorella vulgaris]